MTTLPRTGGTEWEASQASPWNVVNASLRRIDAFSTRCVLQGRQTAPPGACSDGDAYLVETGPTGDWVGHAGDIAVAKGANAINGWLYVAAAAVNKPGTKCYIIDEAKTIVRGNNGGWIEGIEVLVDTTGAVDGGILRYDLSNRVFYVSAA